MDEFSRRFLEMLKKHDEFIITKDGNDIAVVLSYERWIELTDAYSRLYER